MSESEISFLVRIDEYSSLENVARRVADALNCSLTLSKYPPFEGSPVMETYLLGMSIALYFGHRYPDGEIRREIRVALPREDELRCFYLQGSVPEDTEHPWAPVVIDISSFILGVLHRNDSLKWYIPSREQLLMEVGIDPDDLKLEER